MKLVKSANSEGSKWTRRLPISAGTYLVTFGPVVAIMRAKADRDLQEMNVEHITLTSNAPHLVQL